MPKKPAKAPKATNGLLPTQLPVKRPVGRKPKDLGSHVRKLNRHRLDNREIKPKAGTKYDWSAIARDYIRGLDTIDAAGAQVHVWPTLEALAAKYGASPNSVFDYSKRHSWVIQRTEWQAQLRRVKDEADLQAIREAEVRIRRKTLKAAERIIDRMAKEDEEHSIVSISDAQDLASLAGALRKSQEAAHVAIGLPKDGVRPVDAETPQDGAQTIWARMRASRQEIVIGVRITPEALSGPDTPTIDAEAEGDDDPENA